MTKKIKCATLGLLLAFSGCEYGDLNDDPNEPTAVPGTLLLTGTMLADVAINASHINRIAGMWSGQYKGFQSLYEAIYNYNISTEESNSSWSYLYNGIMAQNDIIQKELADDRLIVGITKVIEAHAAGTACSNWGSIPYSEAVSNVEDPRFDTQQEVFDALQKLLDEAIEDLNAVAGYTLVEDIFFQGDKDKWIETAYTLKARYYMLTKQYAEAGMAAEKGISGGDRSMKFYPPGTTSGDQNLIYELLAGSRADDFGTDGTYLSALLTGDTLKTSDTLRVINPRNNAKTNEEARSRYYYIDQKGNNRTGVATVDAPMPLATYEENLLTRAETAARAGQFGDALSHLNQCRTYLASGDAFVQDPALASQYDAYVEADFEAGGMENADNIDKTRALLREIIEERYVSGYGTFMPWNDARRLRQSDSDIAVPFPLNTASINRHPERFPIAQDELNANPNAPKGISIFTKTRVNE